MISPDSLHQHNDMMDALIEANPIQEELTCAIQCNECGFNGEAQFHPYGMKCGGCGGYNTSR
jgi:hypothetical protein